MPKKPSEKIINIILKSASSSFEGVSITEIEACLESPVPRRTLQRYLSNLVEQGLLTVEGGGRLRKYKIRNKELFSTSPEKILSIKKEELIPLTNSSREILNKVCSPIQNRTHVSYNREFLDSYQPNITFYLEDSIRKKLFDIGKSPDKDFPAGTFARKIFNRLLIDLSWNSSRLEGNTYSLLETERLLKFNEPSQGKDLKETQMILNHKAAIEFLVDSPKDIRVDHFTLLNLHALLSNNLLRDPEACGRLRSIPVGISSTVYVPQGIPQMIEECFRQIIDTATAIKDPFEQAFFLMVQIPYLQPFEDVNKRVSRIAANIPLIKENLYPLSFVDVPEDLYISGLLGIYELNQVNLLRDIFIWAYQRSCSLYVATQKSLGEPDPFRLRYRQQISNTVRKIIQEGLDPETSLIEIESQKDLIPEKDQKQFHETVKEELKGLHEGNIARYKISFEEFQSWRGI